MRSKFMWQKVRGELMFRCIMLKATDPDDPTMTKAVALSSIEIVRYVWQFDK